MAGARIGYAIGPAQTIREFEKIRLHFGVNLSAQDGALASLADGDHLRTVVAEVARGRDEYYQLAADLGLGTIPAAANFVAFDTGAPSLARDLLAALAARDAFVRMRGGPPLDRLRRCTVRLPPEAAPSPSNLREGG